MKIFLFVLVFIGATPLAFANGYIGGSYAIFDYSEHGIDPDLTVGALGVNGGYRVNDYVAVEARVGTGVKDGTYARMNLEMDSYFGAYVKVGMPVNNFYPIYPYALLGMTKAELTVSGYGMTASGSESDISYGLGVAYAVNDQISLNVEYANLMDKDGIIIDGFTFGSTYHF